MSDNLQSDIIQIHADALAAQALVIGLMRAMRDRGLEIAAIEEAFDYAANVAIASSHLGEQGPLILKAVDELRSAVIREQSPK